MPLCSLCGLFKFLQASDTTVAMTSDMIRTDLLVDLVSKHAELKALELHHQHCWRLVNAHTLGRSHFLLLLGADVLVGAIQILTGGEALEGFLHRTGFVDFQTEV